ncbi:MAG: hypothetical protein NTW03_12755 [Verrucomicrobia bacterium]|nr:hypothetical protein [Verrucomicrobiota bacterium]
MKTICTTLGVVLAMTVLAGVQDITKDQGVDAQVVATLKSAPAAEIPAKAAQLVKQANSNARQATTIAVVKAAIAMRPPTAELVVAAISKANPEMACVAAATAAILLPKQAASIAKAAAAAAPAQAGRIVTFVCRQAPEDYRAVALAVSQAVPGAAREIVEGVGTAIPAFKASLDQGLLASSGSSFAVAAMLDRAVPSAPAPSAPSPRPAGPTVQPPYWPLTMNSYTTNIDFSTNGIVPPGGRSYAAP